MKKACDIESRFLMIIFFHFYIIREVDVYRKDVGDVKICLTRIYICVCMYTVLQGLTKLFINRHAARIP